MPRTKKPKLKLLGPSDFLTFNFEEYQALKKAYTEAKKRGDKTVKAKNTELTLESADRVLANLAFFYHQ